MSYRRLAGEATGYLRITALWLAEMEHHTRLFLPLAGILSTLAN